MRKIILLSLLILLIINVSCLCENNQININEASLDELDKLQGIGPSRAQAIIDSRPFNSIDDLIEVTGIGEVTLENIKSQNLACTDYSEKEEEKEDYNEEIKKEIESLEEVTIKKENIQKEVIVLTNLDRKDIKSEKNKENLDKNNYAIYGLFGFGILLLFLFMIKKYKRIRKNEFK
jgi:competence ComEA-like helix-hairpin-helix protein